MDRAVEEAEDLVIPVGLRDKLCEGRTKDGFGKGCWKLEDEATDKAATIAIKASLVVDRDCCLLCLRNMMMGWSSILRLLVQ